MAEGTIPDGRAAAAFDAPGPPEVLRLVEVDPPHAGPGAVRVRVRAAGVQPADCALRRTGWRPPTVPEPTPPVVPGNELAGVVDEVGEGVSGIVVGDEVLGYRMLGCYAELVAVPADQVVARPPAMPWEIAGGFSAGAQTAQIALDALEVAAGETLLVNGAAGSVGTMAVQLGRLRGATLIGTAREANHDHLRSLGAVPVTYGGGMAERVRGLAPGGVDVILDAAGGDSLLAALPLARDRDRIGTIVSYDRVEELGLRGLRGQRSAARLAGLVGLWEAGELQVTIRSVHPLARAADAHREVETGHGRGKVVLRVS